MSNTKSSFYKSLSLFVIILSVLLVYCVFWGPLRNWGASFDPARTITVSASDFKYVVPDMAKISFAVVSEGKDIKTISDENNKKINSAIAYLKEKGISEDNIKTSQYNLYPVYSHSTNIYSSSFTPKIEMYSLTQMVEVRVRDFNLVSDIVGSLSGFGINKINNVVFGIEDENKYIPDIQESAFEKAHEKAKKIADQNSVSLGRVINVSVNNNYPYFESAKAYSTDFSGLDNGVPNIQSGSKKLSISVSLKYEIK